MAKLSLSDHRHNLSFNIVHEFFFGFGVAFHDVSTILPLFLTLLGAPVSVAGSIAGLFAILIAAPQLISAIMARNTQNVKAATIKVHLTILPPIFLAGFVFAFFAPTGPKAWMFYYGCFIFYAIAIGFIIPIWTNFLRYVTKRKNRGTFLGISFIGSSMGGFIGGIVVKELLGSSIPFPANFGWGFLILFGALIISIASFLGFKTKNIDFSPKQRSIGDFIHEAKTILKTNQNFRRYIYSRIFLTAQFPAISLYAVYSREMFHFDISEAGLLTAARLVAFGLGSLIAGQIGDRIDYKAAMVFCFACHAIAMGVALTAQSMIWVYGIFFFLGLAQGAFMPAAMSIVFDFAGETGDNKMIMALIDTILSPFVLIAITTSGIMSETTGLDFLFRILGACMLAGLLTMIFLVRDPRKESNLSVNP
ncbi:MAG: MFS transporter [Candidatus Marinimicrobia bacterium]|nr:MFS transporter [Candidatus Neomarinimicrobiota bacterium]